MNRPTDRQAAFMGAIKRIMFSLGVVPMFGVVDSVDMVSGCVGIVSSSVGIVNGCVGSAVVGGVGIVVVFAGGWHSRTRSRK